MRLCTFSIFSFTFCYFSLMLQLYSFSLSCPAFCNSAKNWYLLLVLKLDENCFSLSPLNILKHLGRHPIIQDINPTHCFLVTIFARRKWVIFQSLVKNIAKQILRIESHTWPIFIWFEKALSSFTFFSTSCRRFTFN